MDFKKEFKNPSSEWRSAPFWSWNGEMTGEEASRQMRDFKAHGIGGAFAHPRNGMATEYLSEDFFKAWGETLETAKAEDMKLYMYDENAWPSGWAGGLVGKRDRSVLATVVKCRLLPAADPGFGGELVFAAVSDDNFNLGEVLTDVPLEKWGEYTDGRVMVINKVNLPGDPWSGYCDVTNPRTAEVFLELTHEEYYKRFGEDFGKYVPATFSDEAHVRSDGENTLPYSPIIEAKFKEISGLDLIPCLPAIFRNVTGLEFPRPIEKIRYDFYETLHELWIDNFIKPIAEWCDEHNIAWTGHDIEHQWPLAHGGRINPSEQTTYEYRQWPGLDLLLCDDLKNEPNNMDKFLMYEIRSAANQFAKKRTLCEAYGAGGYQSTLDDYKRLTDFLLVGGINVIVQHLSLYSFAGCRKRDCPQSFDHRQPWWDEYTEFADYIGRACFMLSQGKMEQRILLLNPSTTSYTIPGEEQKGNVDHATDANCCKNPDMTDFLTVVNDLTDRGWDFDLGDEFSLSRHGKTEGKKFRFGEQCYDLVVISKDMKNLRADTVKILLDFAAAGGRIITTDKDKTSFGEYISGETGLEATALVREAALAVDGSAGLCEFLDKTLDKRITSDVPFPTGVQHIRRRLPDGKECYFIVNHAMETFSCKLSLAGDTVTEWDLFTGDIHGIKFEKDGAYVTFPLTLDRCGSAMFVVGDTAPIEEPLPECTKKVPLTEVSIEREKDNTFTLDHPAVEVDGKKYPPRYFIESNETLALSRCPSRPWCGIQFHSDWMDMNKTFDNTTGFELHYTFTVGKGVLPANITVTVERPKYVNVRVNGYDAAFLGIDEFDPDSGTFAIGSYLVEGENTVTVWARKYNVLCEVEAIFLHGDFSVRNEGGKFVMEAPQSLGLGSWKEQGLCFYPYAVDYVYEAELEKAPRRATVKLGGNFATAVSVKVNGEYQGVVGRDGGAKLDVKGLTAGKNKIVFRVCGSFQSLLGPHLEMHEFEPYAWDYFKRGRVAPADEYIFFDYGLTETPTLVVAE
ncbi:MAG: hypothetical protein MJ096_06325 [Clostridia bacterium]|nr:hypothetical protein [Clostridia bacterium]